MILTDQEAIGKIKELSKERPHWMNRVRENSKIYRALVNGDNFCDVLIDKIEFIESADKAKARKKYSKDIRDVFERIMKPRDNVFQSNGGSLKINIQNEQMKNIFTKMLSNFKSNKSVFKYLSENYFKLCDIDPNGLIFLEYAVNGSNTKLYPTYKSTKDIADYEPNGQKLEYVVFEPYKNEPESNRQYWRIVDDKNDRTILEVGEIFIIVPNKSFEHPFGETPGLILSEMEKVGSKVRINTVDKIIELSKDFARDKSILNIYKFQKGYPIHWRFVTQCKSCTGLGKKDNATCTSCNGYGYNRNNDVTDIVTIPIPDIDQPNIAPDIAGYVSPDLETWKQYKDDLKDLEKIMKDTIWGTNLYSNSNSNLIETETATGRYIDIQPITNVLNVLTDSAEYVENTLCNWVANFVDPVKMKDEQVYHKAYGRRFIIENPDVILQRYQEAKKAGDSSTVLDKFLEEFIMSKYKNDSSMLQAMLKKKDIEPYVHMTLDQVERFFGKNEVYIKELFTKFWTTCDVTKDTETLRKEFEAYEETNKREFTDVIVDSPTTK